MKKLSLIGIIALFLACTSTAPRPYSRYSEIQISDKAFKVKYETNITLPNQDIQDSIIYYACKVTLENGQKYFRRHSIGTSKPHKQNLFRKNDDYYKTELTISFTEEDPCNNDDLIYDAVKCKRSFESFLNSQQTRCLN